MREDRQHGHHQPAPTSRPSTAAGNMTSSHSSAVAKLHTVPPSQNTASTAEVAVPATDHYYTHALVVAAPEHVAIAERSVIETSLTSLRPIVPGRRRSSARCALPHRRRRAAPPSPARAAQPHGESLPPRIGRSGARSRPSSSARGQLTVCGDVSGPSPGHVAPKRLRILTEHKAASEETAPDIRSLSPPPAPSLAAQLAPGRRRAGGKPGEPTHRTARPAALPIGITPQTLRHTFASILVGIGEDATYVMQQLGRTDPASTLRVFARAMRRSGQEREQLKALAEGRDWAQPAESTSAAVEHDTDGDAGNRC